MTLSLNTDRMRSCAIGLTYQGYTFIQLSKADDFAEWFWEIFQWQEWEDYSTQVPFDTLTVSDVDEAGWCMICASNDITSILSSQL